VIRGENMKPYLIAFFWLWFALLSPIYVVVGLIATLVMALMELVSKTESITASKDVKYTIQEDYNERGFDDGNNISDADIVATSTIHIS
jgi:hypothetical protein